jgi:hypothetical protein
MVSAALIIIVTRTSMEKFDDGYFTDEKFGGADISGNVLKSWLAECWWPAGGWSHPVPAEVHVRDRFGDGDAVKPSEHNG